MEYASNPPKGLIETMSYLQQLLLVNVVFTIGMLYSLLNKAAIGIYTSISQSLET